MSERQRLADPRASETFSLECAGLHYVATISRFDDGRIAEVFLSNHKAGSHADTAAKDSAVVCSIALQHCNTATLQHCNTATLRTARRDSPRSAS
jgi:hypothetical protein